MTLDLDVEDLVANIVRDEPVVLFALEWCEFCWSVRKFFARLGIAYRDISIDSIEYQDIGERMRSVLAKRTGKKTIPQIFVAGEHIGGCTELFDVWRSGSLHHLLHAGGITFDANAALDPYEMLPKWLQPRETA